GNDWRTGHSDPLIFWQRFFELGLFSVEIIAEVMCAAQNGSGIGVIKAAATQSKFAGIQPLSNCSCAHRPFPLTKLSETKYATDDFCLIVADCELSLLLILPLFNSYGLIAERNYTAIPESLGSICVHGLDGIHRRLVGG